jgi:hypothetical protein
MEKLTEKLEELNQAIVQRIIDLISTKGLKSEHNNSIVLKVQDEENMYNLENGNWLVELNEVMLIDNNGYQYHLSSLSLEKLCGVIDSIADGITPNFRVGTMGSHGTEELYKYFEDEKDAYEHFIEQRADEDEVWMERRVENRKWEFEFETMHTYCADEDEIENA